MRDSIPYVWNGAFFTDARFWECECDRYPIHAYAVDTGCPLCGVDTTNPDHKARWMPASCERIAVGGQFADDDSWLIAYNQEPYYDWLELFDTNRMRKTWVFDGASRLTSWETRVLNQTIYEWIAIKAQVATVDDTTTPKG